MNTRDTTLKSTALALASTSSRRISAMHASKTSGIPDKYGILQTQNADVESKPIQEIK
jgi:hypothetical protein